MAWDSDSGAFGPVQGLVIRDRWMDDCTLYASQEGGAVVGPVVPASGNQGSIYGFAEGTPAGADEWGPGPVQGIDIDVVTGGGINGVAGFARKLTGQADAAYAGLNALTAFFHSHSPGPLSKWYAGTIAYSSKYGRLIAAQVRSATTIYLHWISRNKAMQDEDNWTTISVTVANADSGATSKLDTGLAICEVSDGGLLMFVPTRSGDAADLDVYRSEDGGDTWVRVHRALLSSLWDRPFSSEAPQARGGWRVAVSGDYIRLISLENKQAMDSGSSNTNEIMTLVSPDRGASWTMYLHAETVKLEPLAGRSGGDSGPTDWITSICGVGDQSGTFLMIAQHQKVLQVYIASGTDDWVHYSDLDIDFSASSGEDLLENPYAAWLVRDPDRIWLISISEGVIARLHAYVIDPSDVTDPNSWESWGRIAEFGSMPDYVPVNTVGLWAGECIVLYGAICDPTEKGEGSDGLQDGCALMVAGQWERGPWCQTNNTDRQGNNWLIADHNAVTNAYFPWMGDPTSIAGWAYTGTAAKAQSANYVQISAPPGQLGFLTNSSAGGVQVGLRWAEHFWTQVTLDGSGKDPITDEHMGIRLAPGHSNSCPDLTIRTGLTSFAVYDNHTDQVRFDGTYTEGAKIEWRVGIDSDGHVEIRWRELGGGTASDGPWRTTRVIAFKNAPNTGTPPMSVGVLTADSSGKGSIFRFGEWIEKHGDLMGQMPYALDLPDDLMGAPMTRGGIHVANGITIKWGGSGAFQSDNYQALVDHSRGVENLLLDSPRLMLESVDAEAMSVVLGAGRSTTLTFARWEVDIVMLVGTVDRGCTLQFSDTDSPAAWASPAESVSLSADLYDDLSIIGQDGSCLRLSSASGVLPDVGEGPGLFIRITSGTNAGHTHQILQDPQGRDGWYQLEGEASAMVYGQGASAVIFGDRMVWRGSSILRYRYMRIVFPDVSSVNDVINASGARRGGTATGTHRLGSLVVGTWVPFDVPLDWTFTDNSQPNVTEGRTKGGITWAHTEGPPQRTITGRVVGDVDEFRRRLRRLLDKHHGFSRAPCGLILDGKNLHPDNVLLVRWQSGSQQDEAAWYLDDSGVWRTAGDADIVCVEVP